MIPDEMVEEVRARADIVGVIGEHVELKKAGKDFKGKCPFHDERTPSFHVVPTKGMYHCFGCQKSGDVFKFLMERSGVDFVTAVKTVGARSGIEVREVRGRGSEDDPRRPYFEANAFAQAYYAKELWESERGAIARAYLEKRGLDREVAERFGLGYAPDGWRHLRDAALKHGINQDVLLEVGLVKRSEKDPKGDPYDRLRNRVVFPIASVSGKVVGFGGRLLDPKSTQAKYLNSPETPLYHKSELMYGLDKAKNEIRRAEVVLVVEGYMDVVSLAAAGVKNVVAVSGTSLTTQHAQLLKRFTSRVLLLFDSDKAGLEATFRAGDALLSKGLHPSVVTFPDGEDPDSVAQKEGVAALHGYLDQAVDVLDRKIQILEEKDYFSSIDRKRRAVDKLLPTLRSVSDPTLRDLYIDRVEARTGVQRSTLEAELAQPLPHAPVPTSKPRPAVSKPAPRRHVPWVQGMGAELLLLLLMVKDRTWIERGREELKPDEFEDPTYRKVYEVLLAQPDLKHAPTDLEEPVRKRLDELLADTTEMSEATKIFTESMSRMRGARVSRRLQALDDEIAEAQRSGNDTRVQDLLKEKQELSRKRASGDVSSTDWRRTTRNTLGRKPKDPNQNGMNGGDPAGPEKPR